MLAQKSVPDTIFDAVKDSFGKYVPEIRLAEKNTFFKPILDKHFFPQGKDVECSLERNDMMSKILGALQECPSIHLPAIYNSIQSILQDDHQLRLSEDEEESETESGKENDCPINKKQRLDH